MKIHHKVDVGPLREAAYMALGDQLDAIMKGFAALQSAGIKLAPETEKWVEHCQKVKESLPKKD